MQKYKIDFIELALKHDVLCFNGESDGQFILKSGRKSPYFFNAGKFYTGEALAELGVFYADMIHQSRTKTNLLDLPDLLFGPAYKGIPLVAATSIALYNKYQINIPWSFNRKEAKDHGEGGTIVGHPLSGNILLIDDVITAGTAIKESINLIKKTSAAKAVGIMLMLDRQERISENDPKSAIQSIAETYNLAFHSIINLDDIVEYITYKIEQKQEHNGIVFTDIYTKKLETILQYQKKYGC